MAQGDNDNQTWIQLPDGSYKSYPATTSDEDIRADIQKNFPDAFKPAPAKAAAPAAQTRSPWNETIVSRGLRAGADYLTRKEKEAQTAEQAAAARGEQPGLLRRAGRFARTFYGGSLADVMRTGAGLTTPRALAEMGGAALMPTVGGTYFAYQGAKGMRDAYRRGQAEGWTPENVQDFLMAGGQTALAGAGLRAVTEPRGRIARTTETAEAPRPRLAETAPIPRVSTRDIGNVLETEMARPRGGIPSTSEPFDAVARMRYGKPYDALTHEQQVDIVKGVGAGQEAPLVQEQRTGVERRTGEAPPTGAIPPVERRVAQRRIAPGASEQEIQDFARGQVEEMRGAEYPRTSAFEDFNEENRRRINEAIAQQQQGGIPAAPPEQRITPVRKPPPQPGTPERPPPVEETDPLKREFPDPAVRRFARANGPELVRATEGDPEGRQMVHDLTNVEIRQAALNAGIELGTKHVGTRIGLGPEQVSRQELIAQMLREGNGPRDIVRLAHTEQIGYQRPMPVAAGRMVPGAGMSTVQILAHELGHAVVAGLDGIAQFGIWSHRHPRINRGAAAATVVDLSQFKVGGVWNAARIGNRLYGILEMLTAGAAIDEVLHGIPRFNNPGLAGDIGMVRQLLDDLKINPHLHRTIFDQMVDRAMDRLGPLRDLIREEAGRREENLPVEFHFSKERVDKIIQRARDIRDAAERARATTEAGAGAAPGGAEAAAPGYPANVAGGQGLPAAEAAGPRAAPERLKPFRAPQNTYRFKIIEDVAGEYRVRELTLEAPNIKKAIDRARGQSGPGWRSLTLLSETKPPVEQIPNILPNMPDELARHLEPDEIEAIKDRPQLQRNVVDLYRKMSREVSRGEARNAARAGYGLGGWWQRFIQTFEALGAPQAQLQQMKDLPQSHIEALKAFHSAVSGNKAVEEANRIAWGTYRDWLEQGMPRDKRSINNIIRANRGVSGPGGLDTVKIFKLVNSPQFKEGAPMTGEAFVRSPVYGTSPGSQKIPSMVATTAGKGNLKRVVFDTHMRDLYGLNDLKPSDSQYLAASIHIRQVAEELGMSPGEAQEQMWGTVLGLKKLLKGGMTPRQAARAYGKDVLASVGKDYAQIIQESMETDPEMREIMDDLKKFGFDPGGPVASEKLRQIVEEGSRRMRERQRPINRALLLRSARRLASARAGP